jgi:hypothetical protein
LRERHPQPNALRLLFSRRLCTLDGTVWKAIGQQKRGPIPSIKSSGIISKPSTISIGMRAHWATWIGRTSLIPSVGLTERN